MLDIKADVIPFRSEETCGDFFIVQENSNETFIAVCDIGGHGSINTGIGASIVKSCIESNINQKLDHIIHTVHSLSIVKNRGCVLFLARIYKELPVMEYVAIGNMSLKCIRDQKITNLKIQEGVIGYQIPQNIHTNIIKLWQNDKIIVATDGLSIYDNKLNISDYENKSATEVASIIITQFDRRHDDSLCLVVNFTNTSTNSYQNFESYNLE